MQVVPDNQNRALYSIHAFKILFKEGGCSIFVPLFLNLIASARRYNQFEAQSAASMAHRVDPLQTFLSSFCCAGKLDSAYV
jgi:hypothetical protein